MPVSVYPSGLVDPIEGATVVVDPRRYYLHRGNAFALNEVALAVPKDDFFEVLLKTGAVSIYVTILGSAGGDAILCTFEDAVVDTPGTPLGIFNENRLFSVTPTFTAESGGTYSGGTRLTKLFIPGGTKPNSPGAHLSVTPMRIYKPNTNYLIRLDNRAEEAATLGIEVQVNERPE